MGLALVACSQADDPVGPVNPSYSITFNTADSAEQVTRAGNTEGLQTIGHTEIKVYGYKTLNGTIQNVMPGYTLRYVDGTANSSTSNSTGWEYVGLTDATSATVKDYMNQAQEIKYWDGNSTDYRFFGVLSNLNTNLKYDGQAITSSTVVANDKAFTMEFPNLAYMTRNVDSNGNYIYYKGNTTTTVDEKDIPMYGSLWHGDPLDNYDKPVTLSFSKPYSLVRLVFIRPDGSSVTQLGESTTNSATFMPTDDSLISNEGTVSVTWSMTGAEETTTATASKATLPSMTFDPIELTTADTRYQVWPEYLMVPTTSDDANVDYECTVNVKKEDGSGFDKRTARIPKQFTHWKAGYEYTYVFKITFNNSLEFSHVVETYTKWQAGYADTTKW